MIVYSSGLAHKLRLDSKSLKRLQIPGKVTVLISTVIPGLDNQVRVIGTDQLPQRRINFHIFDRNKSTFEIFAALGSCCQAAVIVVPDSVQNGHLLNAVVQHI